ncbi:MAG: hypothetical protein ABIQ51_07705 [Mesorhizobium sp.]
MSRVPMTDAEMAAGETKARDLLRDIIAENPRASRTKIFSIFRSETLPNGGNAMLEKVLEWWVDHNFAICSESVEAKPRMYGAA